MALLMLIMMFITLIFAFVIEDAKSWANAEEEGWCPPGYGYSESYGKEPVCIRIARPLVTDPEGNPIGNLGGLGIDIKPVDDN